MRIVLCYIVHYLQQCVDAPFQIQPVPSTVLLDVQQRHPEQCENLEAFSPIIDVQLAGKGDVLEKPITLTLPLTTNGTSRQPQSFYTARTTATLLKGRSVPALPRITVSSMFLVLA